jgi:hypothetical protein
MTVRIDLSEYRRSHSVSPVGSRLWLFTFDNAPTKVAFGATGTFAQACAAATREARRIGASCATVRP